MAFEKFKGAATRKAVGATVDGVLKYVNKDRVKGLNRLVDISEYLVGDLYPDAVFDGARRMIADPDNKWMKYVNSMLDDLDPHVVKTHILNIGYQAGFYGYAKTNRFEEEHGYRIPWIILMDPTSACNKHCIGCWSAEYGNRLNLSYEDLASIVRQGEELGIYFYMMTGGEPLVRKDDIIRLAREFPKSMFYAFTNGSLITDEFAETMRELGNISLALSIEGFEGDNDARRGEGSFQEVVKAMEILKNHGLVFGTSICYTSKNYKMVTSDEFLDFLIDHGVRYNWYFHYMPVGNEASTELLLTPEQREYMYHRVREIRDFDGGKPIFTFDFQNDGEFVQGCIAGGRFYCHINPNGDVEPCVFIHYSNANIHDKTLLECLSQPLFQEYQKHQPFNCNHLQPCPMLENPEILGKIVHDVDAVSTDLQSPETPEHLCAKCVDYAADWAPKAQELMAAHPHLTPAEMATLREEQRRQSQL